MRVNGDWFPMANPKAGGTIYNWTLDFHASAHEVAKRFGHAEVLQLLFERTPPVARVVEACWIEDEAAVRDASALPFPTWRARCRPINGSCWPMPRGTTRRMRCG